jgi:hypothetical protein
MRQLANEFGLNRAGLILFPSPAGPFSDRAKYHTIPVTARPRITQPLGASIAPHPTPSQPRHVIGATMQPNFRHPTARLPSYPLHVAPDRLQGCQHEPQHKVVGAEQMSPRSGTILGLLVLATGLFNSVVAYVVMSIGQRFTLPQMVAAAALMVPALICAVWLWLKPNRAALGLAGGFGIVNVLTAMSFGAMFLLGARNPGDEESALSAMGFLVLPNLIVALVVTVMAFRQFGGRAAGPLVLGFGGALVLDAAAGVLAVILSTVVDLGANLQWAPAIAASRKQ